MQAIAGWIVRSLFVGALFGCGGSQPPPEAPAEAEPSEPSAEPSPSAPADPTARPQLSAEECSASGGSVVGDIGDGAVHRPDYRCPNGAAPTGNIRAAASGPVAVEGAVCCPG